MGITLDQLLDATGLDDLSGRALQKQASAPPEHDLSKLAEQLRRASEADPLEGFSEQELVEKTASIAVLERTLAEIRGIETSGARHVKTAAPEGVKARFIKEALAEGYSAAQIAEFLEKEAFARAALGKVKEYAGKGYAAAKEYAGKGYGKAKDVGAKAKEVSQPAREGVSKSVRNLAERAGMTDEQIALAKSIGKPAALVGGGVMLGRATKGSDG